MGIVKAKIAASERLLNPIKLERGTATIPLSGIDVPFHSTYLRDGIGPYRKFLASKILKENIDPEQLVGKYIPNVTGRPFSVDRKYVEDVADITHSSALRQVLETVSPHKDMFESFADMSSSGSKHESTLGLKL
jgi:fatty acid synthase subunit beta